MLIFDSSQQNPRWSYRSCDSSLTVRVMFNRVSASHSWTRDVTVVWLSCAPSGPLALHIAPRDTTQPHIGLFTTSLLCAVDAQLPVAMQPSTIYILITRREVCDDAIMTSCMFDRRWTPDWSKQPASESSTFSFIIILCKQRPQLYTCVTGHFDMDGYIASKWLTMVFVHSGWLLFFCPNVLLCSALTECKYFPLLS